MKQRQLSHSSQRKRWSHTLHGDLNYVVWPKGRRTDYSIELVLGPRSKRTQWCICYRPSPTSSEEEYLYPPLHAGPFPTLKAAKAAYYLLFGSDE